jgi:hypothetical protein
VSSAESQTEPKKRSRRFYLVLAAAVLLIAVIISVVMFEMSNINQTNYGPGPVEIEVVSDKPFYMQGEEVNFTIYVTNPQNWSVPEPYGVTYEMHRNGSEVFGGNVQISFAINPPPSFPPHSRKLYETRVWDGKVGPGDNRTLAPPGTYTYTVLFGGTVDYGNSGNCTFEIRQNNTP